MFSSFPFLVYGNEMVGAFCKKSNIMEYITSYEGWSFNDIVFQDRNKAYGAYVLRQESNYRSMLGLLFITGALFTAFALSRVHWPFLKEAITPPQVILDLTTTDVVLPPVVKPLRPMVQQLPQTASVRFTEMVVRHNDEVRETAEPVRVEAIGEREVSTVTATGALESTPHEPAAPPTIAAAPEIFTMVEEMPEYIGGESKMFQYISSNFEYPAMERENEIQGRVIVGFVVNEDGSISNVQVKKGVSAGIDREAIRVVRSMPKFKPGKQQGRPVKVAFVLPIMVKIS
ncbi:MAG: energy transducer TonB [Chitinophagales bacterium]